MDKRLQIVERLYEGGNDSRSEHPAGAEGEEELRHEYQAMSQAKFWLDHRRAQRPDPVTIERIVEAASRAAGGYPPEGVRADRAPLRLLRGAPLRVAVAASLAVIAVSIGLWRSGNVASTESERQVAKTETAEESAAPPAAENELLRDERGAGVALDAVGANRALASRMDTAALNDELAEPSALLASETTNVPEWEHPEELVQIRQRIEQLKARQSDLGWDKPLVPLEMMPAGAPVDAGIRQAGAKQQ